LRIVIDLQAAQSPQSRNRGIGRYATALARAMLREGSRHEFVVALNGMYEDTVLPVREALEGLIPQQNIVTWHAAIPPRLPASAKSREPYERIRQAFFDSLKPDFVHVASLFEFGELSLASIPGTEAKHRTAVTLFDLIPHIHRDLYLRTDGAIHDYDLKLAQLKRADLWLAISESSRREGIELLGLPGERVVNISCDADEHFTREEVPASLEVELRGRHGLLKPFVMYTGGIDPRKNIEGLIEAWGRLPQPLRESHQLAIVCSVQPDERAHLEELARKVNLAPGELVLTGFVPEDHLVALYRLCKLFVFPSKHEGFGLPALEAMRCGAPVIGADNSSIPEVVGRKDALFDANSAESISAKIGEVLGDEAFRTELARFGQEHGRAFSWTRSARLAIEAMESVGPLERTSHARRAAAKRLRLAYVSPLPPERSGIADYSAELLPALAQHYDIDAVVDQPQVDPAVASLVHAVRDAQSFDEHAAEYDRVLYHMGNSQFHEFMLPLLRRHPGAVALHDFFMSGLQAHRELVTEKKPYWSCALYESHGWHALARRARGGDLTEVIHAFPANFEVLRQAQGVIVHSPYSRQLAREWYGPGAASDWRHVPMLRTPAPLARERARAELGLATSDFLVCSFGFLGKTKMNDRLLAAWECSSLAADPRCRLVFVGQNEDDEFGRGMLRAIARAKGRIEITGWASTEVFRRYLDAADIGVQLRTLSRGETSSAVFDVMNHRVALIANANGTMADLPREAAILLKDAFTDEELVAALELLRGDDDLRLRMGEAGRRIVEARHSPAYCAAAYADAIEAFAGKHASGSVELLRSVADELGETAATASLEAVSRAIAHNDPGLLPARQLFIEIAHWVPGNTQVPPLLEGLVAAPLPGWRAEPVYRDDGGIWRYARAWMQRAAPGGLRLLEDDPVEMHHGDVWGLAPGATAPREALQEGLQSFQLDAGADAMLTWAAIAAQAIPPSPVTRCFVDISELVRHDWQSGIQRVVKHELLELLRRPPAGQVVIPAYTTPGQVGWRAAAGFLHRLAGLPAPAMEAKVEPRAGDVFFALDLQPHFIATNDEYLQELRAAGVRVVFMVYDLLPITLGDCFHPNAAEHHERWLRVVARADTAICISAAVAAELRAWIARNVPDAPLRDIRSVHLGSDLHAHVATGGLPHDAQDVLAKLRRHPGVLMVGTIEPRKAHAAVLCALEELWSQGSDALLVIAGRPGWMTEELIGRLRTHSELGHRLLWIDDASDEYIDALYREASALLLASRGEGFGLPIVEAAQRKLPVIARDLPVFREVAGEHAFYFADDAGLASALRTWFELHARGQHPRPEGMQWLTWAQSAQQLRAILQEPARPE
jgi:glycosyltransferase involved in cell wall biosynthesis